VVGLSHHRDGTGQGQAKQEATGGETVFLVHDSALLTVEMRRV
jgi:hypothetical protein